MHFTLGVEGIDEVWTLEAVVEGWRHQIQAEGLPIYTNPVPDSLIAFSFALKNVTRSNFELSVAEFKINRDENEDGDLDTDHYKVNPRDFFIPTQVRIYLLLESARIVTMAYQGGNLKSTSINGVKMYTVAGQDRSLATWLPPKKIRALRKDKKLKLPQMANFSLLQVLSDDYSKLAFLCVDRSVCLHAKYGSHYSLRIPRMGRDMIYDCWSCDLICAASSPDLYRINLEQIFVKTHAWNLVHFLFVLTSTCCLTLCSSLNFLEEDFFMHDGKVFNIHVSQVSDLLDCE
ncbi:hypothetical protein L6452_30080 [Arctium lappa]|uniref:Uncharacterized protein n=1 Tax=Arctium lappa TaxID=4217 RepID=A0ACB8ZGU9_ARCLA|nr:hypothetical protein L6452_30080 [Arctium lappa]